VSRIVQKGEGIMKQSNRIQARQAPRNTNARALGTHRFAAKVFANRKRTPRRGRWPDHADWVGI
jgi:hypothetical protein